MNLLTISELDKAFVVGLIDRAVEMKGEMKGAKADTPLSGKVLALIFEKASTRTRVSFETATAHLGGSTIFISNRDSQMGRGEPVKDTSRVMSGYVDGVVIRTFGHEIIEEFASYSKVPIINGLTDTHHPCQVLADLLTVVEKKGGEKKGGEKKGGAFDGLKVAWIGDGNNMANSWIEAAALLGFELTLACPKGYEPDKGVLHKALKGSVKITVTTSVEEAATGADVLNTDVWASMGQEGEAEMRTAGFAGYTIDDKVLAMAKGDAIVMHCLPAHRGEEITDEVLEGKSSVVWDQAENRLHIQKAILEKLIG